MRGRDVIRRIPADGNRWLGGSTWRGQAVARISVSDRSATEAGMGRSAEAILRVREASSVQGRGLHRERRTEARDARDVENRIEKG